ncbi:uncharacterized protein LOC111642158 [Centruroides sculpturatus]|uniref:uncharacterized protein LOC111642158 n=1 Tax=Centruroides sculpturatus TaxID=218467 RepID=UPI000C6D4B81|nr:uncharacterized protein LOC111642158 [Centruroides sculpturatus]
MDGVSIKITTTIKYLGVIIDHKLNWADHIAYITDRTNHLFNTVSKVAKSKWGLSPAILSTIYDSVFLPMICYAAPVWAGCLGRVHIERKLRSAQRTALLCICRAFSTSSTTALQVNSGKMPIDLAISLASKGWHVRKGHSICLANQSSFTSYETNCHLSDLLPPFLRPQIKNQPLDHEDLTIYTDGSKSEENVGSAFVVYQDGVECYCGTGHLASNCSAYQAELIAILMAIEWCNNYKSNNRINIFTDCRSTIDAINYHLPKNPLVIKIQASIAASNNNFAISWIRGHAGLLGNERADFLAGEAASLSFNMCLYSLTPASFIKHLLRTDAINTWQERWNNCHEGRTTWKFFPNVPTTNPTFDGHDTHLFTQFLTGHGGFNSYLCRFGVWSL